MAEDGTTGTCMYRLKDVKKFSNEGYLHVLSIGPSITKMILFLSLNYPSLYVDSSIVAMDDQVFARPICQRVYQYLRRHMGGYNLDSFSYGGNVEGSKKNCLEIFLQ
jgi:hypothetical protein